MAGQRFCLDTTFLVDFLRGLPVAVDKARELKEAGADLHTTSINAFELYVGALGSESVTRLLRAEGLLADLRILAVGRGKRRSRRRF